MSAGALVALAAAFVLVAGPGRVEASCGHDVSPRSAKTAPLGLELIGLNGPSRAAAEVPADPRPRPCSGVLCSGSPALPMVPAPAPPTQAEQWGMLSFPAPLVSVEPLFESPAAGRLRPVREGSGIFHPPRTSPLRPLPF